MKGIKLLRSIIPETIKSLPQRKATGQQFRVALEKSGVRQEELYESGLEAYLNQRKDDVITADELAAQYRLRKNPAHFTETYLPYSAPQYGQEFYPSPAFMSSYGDQHYSWAGDLVPERQLPDAGGYGDSTYRELLVHGPGIVDRGPMEAPGMLYEPGQFNPHYTRTIGDDIDPETVNTLFHLRMQDIPVAGRNAAGDGVERLISTNIDEIQSDWAKMMRSAKTGDIYSPVMDRDKAESLLQSHGVTAEDWADERMGPLGEELQRLLKPENYDEARVVAFPDEDLDTGEAPTAGDLFNMLTDSSENGHYLPFLGVNGGTPHLPMSHSKSWLDMGIRRALIDAAQRGSDVLTWTPADEHIERWGHEAADFFRNTYGTGSTTGAIANSRAFRQLGLKPEIFALGDEFVPDRPPGAGNLVSPEDIVGGNSSMVRSTPLPRNLAGVRLTPELRKRIVEKGLPLYMASGLTVGAGALTSEESYAGPKSRLLQSVLADEERMARAAEQGFDTSKIWYTAGEGNLDEMADSPLFFAGNRRDISEYYKGRENPTAYPVFLKKEAKTNEEGMFDILEKSGVDPYEDQTFAYLSPGVRPDEEYQAVRETLKDSGINQVDLLDFNGENEIQSRAVIDPRQSVRSIWAAFQDPKSAKITAGLSGAALAPLAAMQSDPAYADVGSIEGASHPLLAQAAGVVENLDRRTGGLFAFPATADLLRKYAYEDPRSVWDYILTAFEVAP